MDYALNIFRGDVPENIIYKHNPIYKNSKGIRKLLWPVALMPLLKRKLMPFSPVYNLEYAEIAKHLTNKPIISVGGFRTGQEMTEAVELKQIDFIGLCRPLICEPNFISKVKKDLSYSSHCVNCNICAVMCDAQTQTKCYKPI